MNSSDTAKKGFKTFILTLSISLIVFSVIYYALTASASPVGSLEISDGTGDKVGSTEKKSAFGEMAYSKVEAQNKQVLAETTTTTDTAAGTTTPPSTTTTTTTTTTPVITPAPTTTPVVTQTTTAVPSTGATEITIALIFSVLAFGLAMYWQYLNPRAVAMADFEKKSTRGL